MKKIISVALAVALGFVSGCTLLHSLASSPEAAEKYAVLAGKSLAYIVNGSESFADCKVQLAEVITDVVTKLPSDIVPTNITTKVRAIATESINSVTTNVTKANKIKTSLNLLLTYVDKTVSKIETKYAAEIVDSQIAYNVSYKFLDAFGTTLKALTTTFCAQPSDPDFEKVYIEVSEAVKQ